MRNKRVFRVHHCHFLMKSKIQEAIIFLPDDYANQVFLHSYLRDTSSKLFQSDQQIFLGHYTILWVHPYACNIMSIIGALQLSVLPNDYKG